MNEAQGRATSLGHFPSGAKWEFDDSVTAVFDDMIARSIPQYLVMRDLTTRLASRFVIPKTAIVDLGCSRGEALADLVRRFGSSAKYVGIDVSDPMLDAARERFAGWIDSGVVDIRKRDLRDGIPREQGGTSVALSVLTLMFTPINYRQHIIQQVYDMLLPRGAFLLVEKLLGATAATDRLIQDEYHEMKRANGYSEEEVERKRLALEGVQVPMTAAWNEDLLRHAGFSRVECYWRHLNFAGWIAIK